MTGSAATAACDAGALPQLVAALNVHRQPQALAAACHVLATLFGSKSGKIADAAADAGAVQALCAVLADYPRFPHVQARACTALGRLVRRRGWRVNAEALAAASNTGVLHAARLALAQHPTHGALQPQAEALVQLLEQHACSVGDGVNEIGDDASSGNDTAAVDASEEGGASPLHSTSTVAVKSLLVFMRATALDDDAEAAPPAEEQPLTSMPQPPPPNAAAEDADIAADDEPGSAHWSVCVFCRREPRCVLLLPCRHLALCGASRCADRLGFPPCRTCPLCCASVDDTLAVFPL